MSSKLRKLKQLKLKAEIEVCYGVSSVEFQIMRKVTGPNHAKAGI